MTILATIDKEKVDEAYRFGLVKPNEYSYIRDNIIMREIFLRTEDLLGKFKFGKNIVFNFYKQLTDRTNISDAILDLAYQESEDLLIDIDDIRLLVLSDVAYKKATLVRDLGDLNKSSLVTGGIVADKDTIRALEYLLKYKKGMWELLSYIEEE